MSVLPAPATRVRFRVLRLAFFLAIVTYLDRVCISVAAPYMMRDLGLSVVQMSVVFSAFTLAYSLFEIPSGWLGDRVGPRRVLTRIVLWWSAFTMLTGAASSYRTLVGIRFLFGAGEAGAFPNAVRSFATWFPARERGMANGVLFFGSRLGGAITAPIALALIEQAGWRVSFVVFGVFGLVWAGVWHRTYRDQPQNHPDINAAERAWIAQDSVSRHDAARRSVAVAGVDDARGSIAGAGADDAPSSLAEAVSADDARRSSVPGALAVDHAGSGISERVGMDAADRAATPWAQLLASRNLWAICAMYFAFGYGLYFYFTWLPTFLIRELGFSLLAGGFFSSLPFILAGAANLAGGWVTDRIARQHGLRHARTTLGAVAFTTCALLVFSSTIVAAPVAKAVLLAVALASADFALGACWSVCLDVGSAHAGVVTGFMNTFGNLGGLVGPIVVAQMVERWHSWTLPFHVTAAVYLGGALAWLLIDPTKRIA
jgi:ACS family glucarate transporter-like MFS transporter